MKREGKCSAGNVVARGQALNPYDHVVLHALFWLVVANSIGLLISILLIFPNLNQLLGVLTYGRWVPLHLNFQLYGWVSVPLLGFVFFFLLGSNHNERFQFISTNRLEEAQHNGALSIPGLLAIWSTSLLVGGVSWLNGMVTGKVFLDWSGGPAAVFLFGIAVIWMVLLIKSWRFMMQAPIFSRLLRAAVLFILACVPFTMAFALKPEVYPAINPHSGGPTGVSLLGSTLGIILLFIVAPILIARDDRQKSRETRNRLLVLWVVELIVFVLAFHGNSSHRDPWQIAWLALLLPWPLLISHYLKCFSWKVETARWRGAFFFWMVLLFITGFLSFLPGFNEVIKFTNAWVAHAHLALAGLVSSFCMILLIQLPVSPSLNHVLGHRNGFYVWNGAVLGIVIILAWYGWQEGQHPWHEMMGTPLRKLVYSMRAVLGMAMTIASFYWLTCVSRIMLVKSREKEPDRE